MKVTGDKVLIQQDPPKITRGSLYVPDGLEEYPNFGTVLAVGSKVLASEIKEGVRVLFKRKPSTAIFVDSRPGDPYHGMIVLPEDHILAIVEES